MNHIMLDIETLDTKASAAVLSIGAVKFSADEIGPQFHVTLNIEEQLLAGRTVSGSTLFWWSQQSDEARAAAFSQHTGAAEALTQLQDFMSDREYQVWGNGAVFDNAIVTSMYDTFRMKRPWTYKNDRCYRTLRAYVKEQYPHANIDVAHGVCHNALDDAIAQALSLQKIWAVLREPKL